MTGTLNSVIAADKNIAIERGFRFGGITDNNDSDLSKKTQKQLLEELVKLNRDQLKEQKRIREILENEFDPKPKEITLPDGTKCIENSSAKCFKMPMIAEVKKIPAIRKAYENPTMENIKTRELWYAKYTDAVLNDAYMKGQAIRELGPKYPLAKRDLGTIDTQGLDSVVMNKYKKELVNKKINNFEFNLFLGMNESLDMYSLVRLAYLVKENPNWKFNLVFKDRGSKKHWEKQYKNFYAAKFLNGINAVVQPEAFKAFNVYTTPSWFVRDKKRGKDTLLYIGRASEDDMVSSMIEYMIKYKYIKRSDLSSRNAWDSQGGKDAIQYYYNRKLGIKYEK